MTTEEKRIIKRIWKEYILDYLCGAVVGFTICILVGCPLSQIGSFVTAIGGLSAIASFITVLYRSIFNKDIKETTTNNNGE